MRQMPPVQQVHPHERVSRFQQGVIDGVVCRSTRERLDVYIEIVGLNAVCRKCLGATPPGKRLNDICVLDPFVITRVGVTPVVGQACGVVQDFTFVQPASILIWIALRINVVKCAGQRLSHGKRRGAFAGDQDQPPVLTFGFEFSEFK